MHDIRNKKDTKAKLDIRCEVHIMLVFKLSNSQNVRYDLKLNTYDSTYFQRGLLWSMFYFSNIYFNTVKTRKLRTP